MDDTHNSGIGIEVFFLIWILQNVTFTISILMETGKCQHGPMGQTSGSMTSSDQFPRAAHIVC
jgi:hypothetical protein